jgi:hypothetical protein
MSAMTNPTGQCRCGTEMYESRIHTPASNCSIASGNASLGVSATGPAQGHDEFGAALMMRLESYQDAGLESAPGEDAVVRSSAKVMEWKSRLANLLDISTGVPDGKLGDQSSLGESGKGTSDRAGNPGPETQDHHGEKGEMSERETGTADFDKRESGVARGISTPQAETIDSADEGASRKRKWDGLSGSGIAIRGSLAYVEMRGFEAHANG